MRRRVIAALPLTCCLVAQGGLTSASWAAVKLLDAAPEQAAPLAPAGEKPESGPSPVPQRQRPSPARVDPGNSGLAPAAAEPVNPVLQALPAPTKYDIPMAASPSGSTQVANSAEVAVSIQPAGEIPLGTRVSFRITSKKPGYVVLIDIDPSGKLTQIYPNTIGMMRNPRPNANAIKSGTPLLIPAPGDVASGVEYVASPPAGNATIVAVLSERPVQILDLPELPATVRDQAAALDYLVKWTVDLRIPEANGQLREVRWSFDAKFYSTQ